MGNVLHRRADRSTARAERYEQRAPVSYTSVPHPRIRSVGHSQPKIDLYGKTVVSCGAYRRSGKTNAVNRHCMPQRRVDSHNSDPLSFCLVTTGSRTSAVGHGSSDNDRLFVNRRHSSQLVSNVLIVLVNAAQSGTRGLLLLLLLLLLLRCLMPIIRHLL